MSSSKPHLRQAAPTRTNPSALQTAPLWRSLLLFAITFAGCDTKNPVGLWDIVRVTLEAGDEKQEQADLGTMEFLDDDSLIWILRYDPIDPATGEEDWFAPIHPPLRGTGNYETFDEETLSVSLDELWINAAEMEEYQGSTMIYSGGDVNLGTTPVELTLELAR